MNGADSFVRYNRPLAARDRRSDKGGRDLRHPSEPVIHRVLVTGASGFTGAYVREELADAGYEVIGTSAGELEPGAHTLDITSLPECRRLIDELNPAFIVHLAAISFVAH